MAYEILMRKAQNNYEAAEWAENKDFYNTSISRYYYCLYEKAIVIAKKNGFYSLPSAANNSHNEFIKRFQENIHDKLTGQENVWLMAFGKLKELRVEADYHDKCRIVDKNSFCLAFKYYFSQINTILDKLL